MWQSLAGFWGRTGVAVRSANRPDRIGIERRLLTWREEWSRIRCRFVDRFVGFWAPPMFQVNGSRDCQQFCARGRFRHD